MQFVRDYHRKVHRIALAVDGTLAALAPRLRAHFVRAEIKTFAFDQLDAAITWAAGSIAS